MILSYFKCEKYVNDFQYITRFIKEVRDFVRVFESKESSLFSFLQVVFRDTAFDRKCLKADDAFPQVIQDYINSADLSIFCWPESASKSEHTQKDHIQALERAFPQINHKRKQNSGYIL